MSGLVNQVSRRALLLDCLLVPPLALVLVYGSLRATAFQPGRAQLDGVAIALLLITAAALGARRLAPLPSLTVVVAASFVYLVRDYAYGPILFAPAISLYSVGAHVPVRRSLPAAVMSIVALLAPELPAADRQSMNSALTLIVWHGWLLVPWAIGTGLRARREGSRRNRDDAARRLAYEERLRIAREVHDVVGHGLAVINMQAAVALHVVDRRPEQGRVALEAIKDASKDALEELRATLAVFRQPDGAEPAARRPEPGLDQVGSVVTAMTESGLPVDLEVSGRPVAVPSAVDLAAYRIVQESLTNVVRHAGPATATVRVRYEPGEVVLEITDDGRARVSGNGRPGGHGIAGMRERAAAVHGTLEAGPRPQGGFRVLARLPTRAGR